jgi:hypothetical protein
VVTIEIVGGRGESGRVGINGKENNRDLVSDPNFVRKVTKDNPAMLADIDEVIDEIEASIRGSRPQAQGIANSRSVVIRASPDG